MGSKPFVPAALRKMAQAEAAADAVRFAIGCINGAASSAANWADYETLVHFRAGLEEWLSSDHGEAGYEPYIATVRQSVNG
jgi:hypothetical protein